MMACGDTGRDTQDFSKTLLTGLFGVSNVQVLTTACTHRNVVPSSGVLPSGSRALFICIKKKQASGKARGQHNPGNSEDTFGTIHNDNRGAGARSGRGAGAGAAAESRAAGAAAATARRTPCGGRDGGGGGGFKSPGRRRGRGGKYHGHGGGGGPAVRTSGGHSFTVTGVGQLGRADHVAGTGGAGWLGGGGGRGRGGGAWTGGGGSGFDDGFVRKTEGMVLFWKEPACFVQWTPCSFEVNGVSLSCVWLYL